jgi:hypothetical protein
MSGDRAAAFVRDAESHVAWMHSLISSPGGGNCPGSPRRSFYQYQLSDRPDSGTESECEDYYVTDASEIHGKKIPEWASAANVTDSVRSQQAVDADAIFTGLARTCRLSQVFNQSERTYRSRGDSGWRDQ